MATGTAEAAGSEGSYSQPFAEEWDGAQWIVTLQPTIGAGINISELAGISCVTPSFCAAAGWSAGCCDAYSSTTATWNGAIWIIDGSGSSSMLDGVSCFGVSSCLAVGSYLPWDGSNLAQHAIVEHWNGETWKTINGAPTGEQSSLDAIACSKATWCTAVGAVLTRFGDESLVEVWKGTSLSKMWVPFS